MAKRSGYFFIILVILLCGALKVGEVAAAPPVRGNPVPAFTLPDREGKTVHLPQSAQGKVLVLHFWGSTCSFCREEILILKKLLEEYPQDLYAASINVGESLVVINRFLARIEPQHPILLDSKAQVALQYGVVGIPVTFIVDRQGLLRFRIFGEINEEGLRKLLDFSWK